MVVRDRGRSGAVQRLSALRFFQSGVGVFAWAGLFLRDEREVRFGRPGHGGSSCGGEGVDDYCVMADPLGHQAKLVRAGKDGKPITDGVFAESKEFLAGYWIVDVDSPERAFEIAAETSMAPDGPVTAADGTPIEHLRRAPTSGPTQQSDD